MIVSGSDEEQAAARVAMKEILDQSPQRVRRMELPDASATELDQWIRFVSAKIRESRKQAGMTQESLSELSGIPQSHISRLERGEHSPTSRTLEKLAKALHVPTSQFDPSA